MENISNKKNWVYWAYLIGFLIIGALPILSLPPWFSPPDWGKTIVFRIILSILIFVFIWQFFHQPNRAFLTTVKNVLLARKSKIFLPFWLLVSFLGIFLLATFFSLDPNFSFWGSPYRSGGFLNFSFYIICAILAFLVLKEDDWQKIWNFAILIGVFVSILAIFQWQGFFKDFLITYETRPPSTVGNPIMLAIYLLLLSFLTLSFAVKEQVFFKKILYFLVFSLFIFVIILTYSRAVYLGLTFGFLYFVFFFPYKNQRFSLAFRISLLVSLVLASFFVYYINTQKKLPEFIQENKILREIASRLSVERALQDPRISGWKVSWQALKERPILGYGPENFSIAFDKYYDPSLPGINQISESWWDRAHNFVFDISLTAGIPALLIFLSLFGALFFQLQKLKYTDLYGYERGSTRMVAHGIQAAFIGYLVANFFSFDTFSIYLILFLLIGYSFFLIKQEGDFNLPSSIEKKRQQAFKYKTAIIIFLFILLVWFILAFNLKPLQINKEINIALALVENGKCEIALEKMEKILPKKSILDGYLNLKYAEIINNCIAKGKLEKSKSLVEKTIRTLEKATEIMPYYTRAWLLLGKYNNVLMAYWEENREENALKAINKAKELNPKREEINKELITTHKLLINFYIKTENYSKLAENYLALTKLEPEDHQNYASLAFVYKELGMIEEAKKTALKIIELFPEYKEKAEEFLKNLP